MSQAMFIWTDPLGVGRNRWSLFRREFELAAEPVAGVLTVFADTRYRLVVNGQTVGHGPARFFPGRPEADTWDVSSLLRPGGNCVAVTVNSGGHATFHSADSVGGLFACLTVGLSDGSAVEIGTDAAWRAIVSPAHDPATARQSFALNWAEACDLRAWPWGWEEPGYDDSVWPAAVPHAHPEHWGPLGQRSIPLLDESLARPVAPPTVFAAAPRADEVVHRVMLPVEPWPTPSRKVVAAVFTRLWSPVEQEVTLGAWWGRHYLNGQPIAPAKRPDWPWRQDLPVSLRAGWNTFERVEPTYTTWQDWWEFELCLPADAGLRLEAVEGRPEVSFLVGGPWDAADMDMESWPLGRPGDDWSEWLAETPVALPHRDRARLQVFDARAEFSARALPTLDLTERPRRRRKKGDDAEPVAAKAERVVPRGPTAEALQKEVARRLKQATAELMESVEQGRLSDPAQLLGECERLAMWAGQEAYHALMGGDSIWLYDFGTEVLGRAVLDIEAPAGTVFTLGVTERLNDDGTASLAFRHFQDQVEQVIWPGGRHRWQAMHPRGGRWLEVCALNNSDQVTLHEVALSRATYPHEPAGWFECSDPLLTRIWELGRQTLIACREDAYLDCPGRERGLYSGDFLVQYHVDQATFGDTALFRRCIDLFLQTQGENGLISGGCHGLPPGRHPDYTAILLPCLLADLEQTGDLGFVEQHRDRLARLLAGLDALIDPVHGLMDATGSDPYIDLQAMDKGGVSCALNAFVAKAFADGATLWRRLDDDARAEHWQTRADEVAARLREAFWDEARGCFTDRRPADVADAQPSVAANALPVLFGLASAEQAARAHGWLMAALAEPFLVPDPRHNTDCRTTSYFSWYALGALCTRPEGWPAALELMRLGWGRMLDAGAWTCWEYFVDTEGASRCHAWSAAPTWYLSRYVLGISFPEPGNRDRVRIAPRTDGLSWARGAWPHPRGLIEVAWAQDGQVSVTVPDGVEVVRG